MYINNAYFYGINYCYFTFEHDGVNQTNNLTVVMSW